MQGQKGWDGCGLPLTTTAALVVTVRGVIVLLSSWEEWGGMNYKPKSESIKTARGKKQKKKKIKNKTKT